jgi:hypothetical protein
MNFKDMDIEQLTSFINETKDLDLLEQAEQAYVDKVVKDFDTQEHYDEIIEEINKTWRHG